jgi:hypothetical protein
MANRANRPTVCLHKPDQLRILDHAGSGSRGKDQLATAANV